MTEYTKTTGADGVAKFELPYGDYTVTIEADGYETNVQTVAFRKNHKNFPIPIETDKGDYGFELVDSQTEEVLATGTCNFGEESELQNSIAIEVVTCSDETYLTGEYHTPLDIFQFESINNNDFGDRDGEWYGFINFTFDEYVTITCLDDEENPLSNVITIWSTEAIDMSTPNLQAVKGLGDTQRNGVAKLYGFKDGKDMRYPIPYANGSYWITALINQDILYQGQVQLDAEHRNFTLTLTPTESNQEPSNQDPLVEADYP